MRQGEAPAEPASQGTRPPSVATRQEPRPPEGRIDGPQNRRLVIHPIVYERSLSSPERGEPVLCRVQRSVKSNLVDHHRPMALTL